MKCDMEESKLFKQIHNHCRYLAKLIPNLDRGGCGIFTQALYNAMVEPWGVIGSTDEALPKIWISYLTNEEEPHTINSLIDSQKLIQPVHVFLELEGKCFDAKHTFESPEAFLEELEEGKLEEIDIFTLEHLVPQDLWNPEFDTQWGNIIEAYLTSCLTDPSIEDQPKFPPRKEKTKAGVGGASPMALEDALQDIRGNYTIPIGVSRDSWRAALTRLGIHPTAKMEYPSDKYVTYDEETNTKTSRIKPESFCHETGKLCTKKCGWVCKDFPENYPEDCVKETPSNILNNVDNINRTRSYGLRVGDLVTIKRWTPDGDVGRPCEVIERHFMDNNRVFLEDEKGAQFGWVAEHCTIVTKVEDRK